MLYVEDNPADVLLVREALKEIDIPVQMTVVENGVLAMAYIRKEQQFAAVSTPDLILLDLNLPKKPGEQVLAEIKADLNLRGLPVVVFSSGADDVICGPLYRQYASTCIQKPIGYEALAKTIRQLCE